MINRDLNPDFLNSFLDYSITILNKSPNSIKEYNYDLSNFLKFIKVEFKLTDEKDYSKIDISDCKNYTLYLESEKKTVYLGDCSDLNTRILYVKAIIEQESGIAGEIFVNVDLNDDNVFFREKI